MKPFALFFIFLFASVMARAESFVVDRHCDGIAELLQKAIPGLAVDLLFEAKRGSAEWHYAFRTKAEKTWAEEVRISVSEKAASSSEVVVEVLRVDGGFVKSAAKPQPLAVPAWTEKIRELLKK